MKIVFKTIFFLLLINSGLVNGAVDNADILDIRSKYNHIVSVREKLSVDTFTLFNVSTEGAKATVYKDKNILLIELERLGETYKSKEELYYHEGKLIFVLQILYKYNAPTHIDEKRAKELGIDPYDENKTRKVENRYYFKDRVLIRWLDNDKNEISSDTEEYREKQRLILLLSDEVNKELKIAEKESKEFGITY